MAEIVTQEQYEQLKETYREQKGYDDMTDEEQEAFDEKLDQAMSELYEVSDDDDSEQTESNDLGEKEKTEVFGDDIEQIKTEVRDRYGYDEMSDHEKAAFDEQLDQYCDEIFEVTDEKAKDKTDDTENAHVKKLIR